MWFAVLMLAVSFVQQVSSHGEQPLARIAVQETVFALDGRVSIKASPSVLGARVRLKFFPEQFKLSSRKFIEKLVNSLGFLIMLEKIFSTLY